MDMFLKLCAEKKKSSELEMDVYRLTKLLVESSSELEKIVATNQPT